MIDVIEQSRLVAENTMTHESTVVIIDILTSEKELSDINIFRMSTALDYLLQLKHSELNKADISHINAVIRGINNNGNYRVTECRPYGSRVQYINSSFVPYVMQNWLLDINEKKLSPSKLLLRFLEIHPFLDGNGRTGKLLEYYCTLPDIF